jgi:drug/metabolite transporter (DMT)-like permease
MTAFLPPARHLWVYFLLLVTTFFWGGNFVVGRAMHDEIGPVAMAFWRWAIALMAFLPFAWRDLRAQAGLIRKHWRRLALLGVLGMTGFHTLLYAALQSTIAVNAALIMATTPIFIALIGRLLYADRVSRRQAAGILVSLTGVGAIVLGGDLSALLALDLNQGDVIMICSAPLWAAYTVIIKRLPQGFRPMTTLGATASFGLIFLAPFYFWEIMVFGGFEITPKTLSTLFYLGILTSALAYAFWNKAVATLGPNRTGVFMNLVPLTGALLAVVFLGEVLRPFHAFGAVFIFAGIYLTTASGSSK